MREAIVHIPHAAFEGTGLAAFVSLVREAGVRDVTELVCRSDGCLVAVTVDERLPEGRLDGVERLAWWERLGAGTDGERYLCKVTFPEGDGDTPLHNGTVSNEEIRVRDDGIDVALVGEQADISREIEEYESAGIPVLLRRLADYDGPRTTADALTDRQREVLRTAYDLGYFAVPRRASTADVADEFDLDPSTVAEHLQRAERNLVSALLESA